MLADPISPHDLDSFKTCFITLHTPFFVTTRLGFTAIDLATMSVTAVTASETRYRPRGRRRPTPGP